MKRKKLPKDTRKKQILDAAFKCFCENGFGGASISEIAEISGMSKGNVYVYFNSKEEIFMEVVESWRARMLDEIQEDLDRAGNNMVNLTESMIERLHFYSVHQRHFLLSWLEFTMAAGRNEHVRSRLNEIQEGIYLKLEGFFKRMADAGRIDQRDVSRYALLLDSLYAGLVLKSLMRSDNSMNKKILRNVAGLVDELLLPGTCELD